MTESAYPINELRTLADRVCNGQQTAEDAAQLERLLCGNPEAQRFYLARITFDTWLRWEVADQVQEPKAPSDPAPVLSFIGTTTHGTADYLSSGWPVAYLVATIIFAIGLLVGALVHVSGPTEVAWHSASLPSPLPAIPSVIGRVTGMTDCRWADAAMATVNHAPVEVGRQFVLTAGLLEITYDSGARVILQGPVTYDVESPSGGYLAIGKLTARLDSHSEISNRKSQISSVPPPLFTIKTPTALVTDLGTEFGVEVDKAGQTTSHVFRGTIELRTTSADGKTNADAKVLHANESVRVEGIEGRNRIVVVPAIKPTDFIREIPGPIVKVLDLVDVVAGGDGFSGKRNRGIDPTTGRISLSQPSKPDLKGDYQYHRVEGIPYVDGIFIPDGSKGPVQVDSIGCMFDSFFATDNIGYGHIWAGDSVVFVGPSQLADVNYASAGHGALFLHANKGITFDLEAIRQGNPGCRLLRFRATVGNTQQIRTERDCDMSADFHVLVDGRSRCRRRQISGPHGAFAVAVPITETNRFLTLAATDGGNTIEGDCILFGDPRLEMLVIERERTPGSKEP